MRLGKALTGAFWRLLAQLAHFAQQEVNVLLLAHDDGVELVQQVFLKTDLDLQIGQALVGDVVGRGWVWHIRHVPGGGLREA